MHNHVWNMANPTRACIYLCNCVQKTLYAPVLAHKRVFVLLYLRLEISECSRVSKHSHVKYLCSSSKRKCGAKARPIHEKHARVLKVVFFFIRNSSGRTPAFQEEHVCVSNTESYDFWFSTRTFGIFLSFLVSATFSSLFAHIPPSFEVRFEVFEHEHV